MANTTKKQEIKGNIIMDDDSDMPAPQTKTYKHYLKCTDRFMSLINNALGSLPYGTVITNNEGEKKRLSELYKFIEAKKDKMEIQEMNTFISYMNNVEFSKIRPFMEIVENKQQQYLLWTLIEE